jgi:hypothetical protein
MRQTRNPYKSLVGKPEGKKRSLRRPTHRSNDNIKMDLKHGVKVWTGLN